MKGGRVVRENRGLSKRLIKLSFCVAAGFFLLLTRLWYLQIIKADTLFDLSESNRLRSVPVAACRGTILDRNGVVLVSNSPSYSLAVIPQDVVNKEALIDSLVRLLGLDRDELLERWEKGKGRARYVPIVVAAGITRDQVELLEENQFRLPGVDVEVKPVRLYPFGTMAAHLMGYLAEVSDQELAADRYQHYNAGDYVGKNGLEKSYENELHGTDGGRRIEVDARGHYLRTISETNPTTGNSLELTIDKNLQQSAEKAFGQEAGAAVALDVNSGEVLAFVSNPGFDPALFSGRMPPDVWKSYLEDKRHPLENKALKGQYPPGSTFKIITALAGLEEGLIDGKATVECTGSYKLGSSKFNCWNRHGHGVVNLKRALKESCDVYFYELGEKLGVDRIAKYARLFGMGKPLGIDLDNERGGLIPTMEWKEKRFHKKWFPGETPPVAIGQGYVLATPIQLASMIATVANNGTVYRPHLVKRIIDPDGRTVKEFGPEIIAKTGLRPESFQLVKEGLFAVVNEPKGTGSMARLYEVKVAGKTGTSQVVKLRDSKGNEPYQFRDHALFVGFAPYDKPEIAVAVVVEHGEHGGSAAAPIAGKILRTYFEEKGVIAKPVRHDASAAGSDKPAAQPAGQPVQLPAGKAD